ncbi:hypothetical protein [Agaribacter flavus]|uniref:Alginate export domain-containing protein n=1 Tax=Agaribacter flavus TaxID=1902781 RepID=A0ABV7FPY3_9ALTE
MIGNFCGNKYTFCLVYLLCVGFVCEKPQAKSFTIEQHNIDLGVRPRLAYIDGSQDAKSASMLFRIRANSEWTEAFSSTIEIDYVVLGLQDEFSNGVNFNNNPVIPDVEGIDVNQLYFTYSINNVSNVVIGREVINLGNERFVGSNSFWQNEQSFDTAGIDYEFASASSFVYRYVSNANRITGDQAGVNLRPSDANFEQNNGRRPASFLGDHTHNTHLFFTEIREFDHAVLQAYFFDMDIEEMRLLSNQTLGLRYQYRSRFQSYKASLDAEYAVQRRQELGDNRRFNYYKLGLGIGFKTRDLFLRYEVLGENNDASFVTPLASLHDQNGWADKFLVTPAKGLRDLSVQTIWRISPFKLDIRYHVFTSELGDEDFGKELDIDLSLKFSHNNTLLLRFADFNSDNVRYNSDKRVFLQYSYHL